MLSNTFRLTALCSAVVFGCALQAAEPNTLTKEEQAAGWRLLFDGKTYNGWTGMKGSPLPEAYWEIEDGALGTVSGEHGLDLVTTRPYEDFELTFDVKILAEGNSGVKYLVRQDWTLNPDRPGLQAVGHEYQVLDDATLRGKPGWEKESMGSFYLVYAPEGKKQSPFGEWNTCRVRVRGDHVEHWLNGDKILEYQLGTKELFAQVQQTKFRNVPGFGSKAEGYIVLTHHESPAWFRNIKIRELK
jgi:hypothetical protein